MADNDAAKTFDAGLAVIEALAFPIYKEMTSTELSEVLNMPVQKVLRLLETARRRQWVEQMPDKRWRPAPKLSQLGMCFSRFYEEKKQDLINLGKDHTEN
jgi:DNA-binding IclR family transcriptional regulator